MFAVMQFTESQGGGLAIISRKWLTPRKKEVFWPNYKDPHRYAKAVKKNEDIDVEKWQLYEVEKIFYETDDYDKALKKLKLAEVTSDLQSDEDTRPAKRRKLKPLRFVSSSESENETEKRKLPPPPSISCTIRNSPRDSPSDCHFESPQRSQSTLRYKPRNKDSSFNCVLGEDLDRHENFFHHNLSNKVDLTEAGTSLQSDKSGFHVLLQNIIEVKNQNKVILGQLAKLTEKEDDNKSIQNLEFELPIKDLEGVEAFESFLAKDQKTFDTAVKYFCGLGGGTVASRTNKILKTALDDAVCTKFNFMGRNEKKAFRSLKLCACIIDAVKISSDCSSVQVENAIKTWLKHAPQRLKKKE